jgi:hypothetical protein
VLVAAGLWSVIFPLGMYAVAGIYLGRADSLPIVAFIGRSELWVAVAAFLATFAGMLWHLWSTHLRPSLRHRKGRAGLCGRVAVSKLTIPALFTRMLVCRIPRLPCRRRGRQQRLSVAVRCRGRGEDLHDAASPDSRSRCSRAGGTNSRIPAAAATPRSSRPGHQFPGLLGCNSRRTGHGSFITGRVPEKSGFQPTSAPVWTPCEHLLTGGAWVFGPCLGRATPRRITT